MLRKADNVFSVIVDDNTVALPGALTVGTVVTNDNLTEGAVCLVDMGNRRMDNAAFTALANGEQFRIVQSLGANQPLMMSPVITVGHFTTSIQRHLLAVQQVTTIGSNGTTGSLPAANDTSYYIKIRKNDNDAGNRSQPFSLFGQFKTDGTATQSEVAFGLAGNLITNLAKEAAGTNGYIRCEVLSDDAATNPNLTTAQNWTFTNGSKIASAASDATDGGGLAAGDYIRVTGAATETVTDPVYRVVSIDAAADTIELDIPFQGDTVTTANTNLHLIAAVDGLAGNFGIRLTGRAADFDVNKMRDYYVNRFTATFSDADTTVTTSTGARNGSGQWQQVAMDEYMSWGYEGMNEMIAVPPTNRASAVKIPGVGGETALTSRYSTLNIKWDETITGLVGQSGAKGNVIFHVNLDNTDPLGILDTTASSGEILVEALGLTATDFDMLP